VIDSMIVLATWRLTKVASEKTLLKLTNYILSEKLKGNAVSILWLLSDRLDEDLITSFITNYQLDELRENFFLQFISLAAPCSNVEVILDEVEEKVFFANEKQTYAEQWFEIIPEHIARFITSDHKETLEIIPPSPLDGLPIWYFGITNKSSLPTYIEDNEIFDTYKNLLPSFYKPKVVALLAYFFQSDCETLIWIEENDYKVRLICFAMLLHGFVNASDYDWYDLDNSDAIASLQIDNFYLGSLLKKSVLDDLSSQEYDDEYILNIALHRVFEGEFSKFMVEQRNKHSANYLFAILWWCVSPEFDTYVEEKLNNLLNDVVSFDIEDRRLAAYEFVESGTLPNL